MADDVRKNSLTRVVTRKSKTGTDNDPTCDVSHKNVKAFAADVRRRVAKDQGRDPKDLVAELWKDLPEGSGEDVVTKEWMPQPTYAIVEGNLVRVLGNPEGLVICGRHAGYDEQFGGLIFIASIVGFFLRFFMSWKTMFARIIPYLWPDFNTNKIVQVVSEAFDRVRYRVIYRPSPRRPERRLRTPQQDRRSLLWWAPAFSIAASRFWRVAGEFWHPVVELDPLALLGAEAKDGYVVEDWASDGVHVTVEGTAVMHRARLYREGIRSPYYTREQPLNARELPARELPDAFLAHVTDEQWAELAQSGDETSAVDGLRSSLKRIRFRRKKKKVTADPKDLPANELPDTFLAHVTDEQWRRLQDRINKDYVLGWEASHDVEVTTADGQKWIIIRKKQRYSSKSGCTLIEFSMGLKSASAKAFWQFFDRLTDSDFIRNKIDRVIGPQILAAEQAAENERLRSELSRERQRRQALESFLYATAEQEQAAREGRVEAVEFDGDTLILVADFREWTPFCEALPGQTVIGRVAPFFNTTLDAIRPYRYNVRAFADGTPVAEDDPYTHVLNHTGDGIILAIFGAKRKRLIEVGLMIADCMQQAATNVVNESGRPMAIGVGMAMSDELFVWNPEQGPGFNWALSNGINLAARIEAARKLPDFEPTEAPYGVTLLPLDLAGLVEDSCRFFDPRRAFELKGLRHDVYLVRFLEFKEQADTPRAQADSVTDASGRVMERIELADLEDLLTGQS